MKLLRINNTTIAILEDGTSLQAEMSDSEFDYLCSVTDRDTIMKIMCPEYNDILNKRQEIEDLYSNVLDSNYLVRKGDAIYWEEVSQLSMPEALVKAVLDAEDNEDFEKLEAYKNFWTLMSLNPDSRCRQNLFWFLNKWGMKISKYGLFVGYRNVDTYQKSQDSCDKYTQEQVDFVVYQYNRVKHNKKSPKNYTVDFEYGPNKEYKLIKSLEDDSSGNLYKLYQYFKERNFDLDLINPNTETIYTDHYSHTFRIKIGEMVNMPREKCDTVQENSCSRGLIGSPLY